MAPKPKAIPQNSQSTDFAEQLLEHMMGSIKSGYATPLQQNVGSSFEQLMSSQPYDTSKEFAALTQVFGQMNKTGAANIREGFSGTGSRYGSAAATGEGRFFAETIPRQQALMAQIGRESYESNEDRKLRATQGAGGFSAEAFAPYIQLALSGIYPDQIFMQENPWMTGFKVAKSAADTVAGFISPSGGGGGNTTNYYGGV